MNQPTRTKNQHKLWFRHFDDTLFDVDSFSVDLGMSVPFRIGLEVSARQPGHANISTEKLLGKGAGLFVFGREFSEPLHGWSGVVTEIRALSLHDHASGTSRYALRIEPTLAMLRYRKNSRVFQHATTPQIVKAILEEWNLRFDMSKVNTHDAARFPYHEMRVQYEESDFHFVSRLLEEAGISYFFSFSPGATLGPEVTTLVLSSDPEKAKATKPLAYYGESLGANVGRSSWHATNVRLVRTLTHGKVLLRDHDFRNLPNAELRFPAELLVQDEKGKRAPLAEDPYEDYDYVPGAAHVEGPALVDDSGKVVLRADSEGTRVASLETGLARAADRLLAKRVHALTVSFSTEKELVPGTVVKIGTEEFPAPRAEYANPVLVTGTRVVGGGAGLSIVCSGVFAPSQEEGTQANFGTPYRPLRRTQKPRVPGPQTAIVVGPPGHEVFPDELGRVRVQFHWDREHRWGHKPNAAHPAEKLVAPLGSCWVRVATRLAGANFGLAVTPRVGHEVLVDFLDGDPDLPVIVGSLYNHSSEFPREQWSLRGEERPPPMSPSSTGLRTLSTPYSGGYNEVLFQDQRGKELIRVRGEKDLNVVVKHKAAEHVGRSRVTRIGRRDGVDAGHEFTARVGDSNAVQISSTHRIAVTIGGSSIVLDDRGIWVNSKGTIEFKSNGNSHYSSLANNYMTSGPGRGGDSDNCVIGAPPTAAAPSSGASWARLKEEDARDGDSPTPARPTPSSGAAASPRTAGSPGVAAPPYSYQKTIQGFVPSKEPLPVPRPYDAPGVVHAADVERKPLPQDLGGNL